MFEKRENILVRFVQKQESGVLLLILLFVAIASSINRVFICTANVLDILRAASFTLITTVGMTYVLISGGLDLSVGSTLCFGGATCSLALQAGLPITVSVLIGVASGALVGLVNAFIIVKFNIPALMVTLGTQYVARGIVYVLTKGVPIYPLPVAFKNIEQKNLIWKIPNIVIIAVIIAIIGHIVLKKTTFGRNIYAIGGNTEAARISGINVNRVKYSVYIITGALAGLTGVFMAARMGSGQATAGTAYELTVIAAAVIGGTSPFAGVGSIFGSSLGALFMQIMENSLTVMKIDVYWQNIVVGAILIFAVTMDQYKRTVIMRKSAGRGKAGA